jgi:hypothetical protein
MMFDTASRIQCDETDQILHGITST